MWACCTDFQVCILLIWAYFQWKVKRFDKQSHSIWMVFGWDFARMYHFLFVSKSVAANKVSLLSALLLAIFYLYCGFTTILVLICLMIYFVHIFEHLLFSINFMFGLISVFRWFYSYSLQKGVLLATKKYC